MAVAPVLWTYSDALEYLVAQVDGLASEREQLRARAAVVNAYQEIAQEHEWRYFRQHGRIKLNAAQTGTITSAVLITPSADLPVGLRVNLSGVGDDIWPSWAASGRILFDGDSVEYTVHSRVSDSMIYLDEDLSPSTAPAASTGYTLFQTVYPISGDVRKISEINDEDGWWSAAYVSPEEWLSWTRYYQGAKSSSLFRWTIMGDSDNYGQMAIYTTGYSTVAETIDFIAHRSPRPLRVAGVSSTHAGGAVAATAGTNTARLNVVQTDEVIGSVLRLRSSSPSHTPTGLTGLYPYQDQRIITGHEVVDVGGTDYSDVTLDANLENTYTVLGGGVFAISDPLDLPEYLLNLFRARLKLELLGDTGAYQQLQVRCDRALIDALARDATLVTPTPAAQWRSFVLPSATWPISYTVTM